LLSLSGWETSKQRIHGGEVSSYPADGAASDGRSSASGADATAYEERVCPEPALAASGSGVDREPARAAEDGDSRAWKGCPLLARLVLPRLLLLFQCATISVSI
jgi:hypothetical protein